MTLYGLITLMILPLGTSGTNEIQFMKYTSEYILKLQVHQQHSEVTNTSTDQYFTMILGIVKF